MEPRWGMMQPLFGSHMLLPLVSLNSMACPCQRATIRAMLEGNTVPLWMLWRTGGPQCLSNYHTLLERERQQSISDHPTKSGQMKRRVSIFCHFRPRYSRQKRGLCRSTVGGWENVRQAHALSPGSSPGGVIDRNATSPSGTICTLPSGPPAVMSGLGIE